MRRIAVLALLACLLLCSGCAIQLEESPPVSPAPDPVPQALDLSPRIEIEASLFFLNSSHTKFQMETRSLRVEQNAIPEVAIVQAVLDGPAADGLDPVATGFRLDRVEVMPDLINVYLVHAGGSMDQWNLSILKMALAASLIDYSGVRYVNMLVDGVEPGYIAGSDGSSVPMGAAARPGDLNDELSLLLQKSVAASYDAFVALYFLDPSESWLLPEVVRVTIAPGEDMVRRIVEQLLAGPQNIYSLRRSLDVRLELLQHEFVDLPTGGRMLRLMFNRLPTVYTSSFVSGEQMSAAALAYTLTDFIPGIQGVELTDRTNPSRVVACRPAEYADLIGNRISVFLPNTPAGTTMTSVERVVPQAQSNDLYTILEALLQGPLTGDSRSVWPAAPDGIAVRSVLDAYRAEEIIVVNLDSAVTDVLKASEADNERILLFSVVNTLTNLKGVRSVLFLLDGERTEYLGTGPICVLDPIMRNPGIIR